jgi:hypothetical protein
MIVINQLIAVGDLQFALINPAFGVLLPAG